MKQPQKIIEYFSAYTTSCTQYDIIDVKVIRDSTHNRVFSSSVESLIAVEYNLKHVFFWIVVSSSFLSC